MVEMTEQIAQIELKEKMRRSLLERANMNEHIHSMQLESGMCGLSLRLHENIVTSYISQNQLSTRLY